MRYTSDDRKSIAEALSLLSGMEYSAKEEYLFRTILEPSGYRIQRYLYKEAVSLLASMVEEKGKHITQAVSVLNMVKQRD